MPVNLMLLAILQLFAGTGMFLFAMHLIEEALKNLSGRPFKLFLQRATKNDLSAVAGGALVTAILQSSSMVSMMTLAFVGAGIFTFRNAMAVILGANLGTTLYSWVVATLGFKVDIVVAAYPAIGLGGFLVVLFSKREAIKYSAFFLMGFGLLFIGLGYMKEAMSGQHFNIAQYAHFPLIAYLGIGFVITLLVQASSVMMALALTALHAGSITYPVAAALVLGAETGTSVKLFIAGMGDNAIKKRIALGNFLINVVLTLVVFLLIRQILWLITKGLGIADPLIALVSFSTLVNLLTIVVFLPLLGPFTRLLEKFYTRSQNSGTPFLMKARAEGSTSLLPAFIQETAYFLYTCMSFNRHLLDLENDFPLNQKYEELLKKMEFSDMPLTDQYLHLKRVQGEIQANFLAILPALSGESKDAMEQLNSAVRNGMYSVKSMNDVEPNISNLKHSSKDIKYGLFTEQRKLSSELYQKLGTFLSEKENAAVELEELLLKVTSEYEQTLEQFYNDENVRALMDTDITTFINFNREIYSSHKAMVLAVKEYLNAATRASFS